jgi:hypothetical protein
MNREVVLPEEKSLFTNLETHANRSWDASLMVITYCPSINATSTHSCMLNLGAGFAMPLAREYDQS